MKDNTKILFSIIKDTIPTFAGYVILGAGFGILMNNCGYGLLIPVLMSVFIYAGSMQYAAVGLLTGGASYFTIALTTLAVNARHLFYGISMIEKYKSAGAKKPYLIFALTDETYSLVCGNDKATDYCLKVSVLNHIYWVGGTALGSFLGDSIPFDFKGVDFALTALFVTVFIDQWMNNKNHFAAVAGVVCSVISLLIFGGDNFLIPAMAGIAAILILPYDKLIKRGNNK